MQRHVMYKDFLTTTVPFAVATLTIYHIILSNYSQLGEYYVHENWRENFVLNVVVLPRVSWVGVGMALRMLSQPFHLVV